MVLKRRPFAPACSPAGACSLEMDYSVTFARHFSRLLWLLLNESANIEEQKAALRATVTVAKDGPVTFVTQDWRLIVNGARSPRR